MARSIRVSQDLPCKDRRAVHAYGPEYPFAAIDADGSGNVYQALGIGREKVEKRTTQECDVVWMVRSFLRTWRVDLCPHEREPLCVCRPGRGLTFPHGCSLTCLRRRV